MRRIWQRLAAWFASDEHEYLSTYCVHGLHGDCRLVCKHCPARCVCPCHVAMSVPVGTPG